MAYGLGTMMRSAIEGGQAQADRMDKQRELDNRRARRGVVEQREDDEYARKVSRYAIQDTLDQQQVGLGEQNLESVTRENDVNEAQQATRQSVFEAESADKLDKAKTGKATRELDREHKQAQTQGQRITNRYQSALAKQKKIDAEISEALKDAKTFDKAQELESNKLKRQYEMARANGYQAASMINEDGGNGITNAHNVLFEKDADGRTKVRVVDIEGNTVEGKHGPAEWFEDELRAGFYGKDVKDKWEYHEKDGIKFNAATGEHDVIVDKGGPNAKLDSNARALLKDGSALLKGEFEDTLYGNGSLSTSPSRFALLSSAKEEFFLSNGVYQQIQRENPGTAPGVIVEAILGEMGDISELETQPGGKQKLRRALLKGASKRLGKKTKRAEGEGIEQSEDRGKPPTQGGRWVPNFPEEHRAKMKVDEEITWTEEGNLKGTRFVLRSNGWVEVLPPMENLGTKLP